VVARRGRGLGRAITKRLLVGGGTVVLVDPWRVRARLSLRALRRGLLIPLASDAVGKAVVPSTGRRFGLDPGQA